MKVNYVNISWDGKTPFVGVIGKKTYTFINRFKGLLGECLVAVMDEKNKYKVMEYDQIRDKEIIVLG